MTVGSRLGVSKKLFKFHPERFYLLRDHMHWEAELAFLKEIASEVPEGHRLFGVSESMYHRSLAAGIPLVPAHEKSDFGFNRISNVFAESHCHPANDMEKVIADWQHGGKHLFDLSPISAMFAASTTKACHMPLSGLQFPFNDFYIHWGPHVKIPTGMPGRYIDGCYVTTHRDGPEDALVIAFGFTCCFPEGDPWEQRSIMGNVVMDAEGFFYCWTKETGLVDDTIHTFVERAMNSPYEPEAITRKWGQFAEAALAMAANCLYYLAWEGRDIEDTFDAKAPLRLVNQAKSQKQTESKRGLSKLNALGFRVIKLCGSKLARKIGIVSGNSEMPAHWRRGHLHVVRFGPQWSKRKVVWRDGVLVNSHKGNPTDRRLYEPRQPKAA